jgi:hypothetical protein
MENIECLKRKEGVKEEAALVVLVHPAAWILK